MTNKRFHIISKVLLFLIAFFISTQIVYHFTPTIQVHAERYSSGQGKGDSKPTKPVVNGPTADKTCIAIYIAEKGDGEPASNAILISDNEHVIDREQGAYRIDSKDEKFQWKLHVAHFARVSNMERPVISAGGDWSPNGNKVANWLMDPSPSGLRRWEVFAKDFWSTEPAGNTTVYNKLIENPEDYVLIVVPVAWMNIYKEDINTGKELIATADGWAKQYREMGDSDGSYLTNRMTHQDLPYSMTVSGTWFECHLQGHDGERKRKLSNDEILTEGYAMHIIELDGAIIHTYDELSEKRIRLNKTSEMSFFI